MQSQWTVNFQSNEMWTMQNSRQIPYMCTMYLFIAIHASLFFPLILTDVTRLVIHELPSFPPPPQRQGDQLVIIWGVRLSLNFIIKKLQTHAYGVGSTHMCSIYVVHTHNSSLCLLSENDHDTLYIKRQCGVLGKYGMRGLLFHPFWYIC